MIDNNNSLEKLKVEEPVNSDSKKQRSESSEAIKVEIQDSAEVQGNNSEMQKANSSTTSEPTNNNVQEITSLKISFNNFITQQINIMMVAPLLAYLTAEVSLLEF